MTASAEAREARRRFGDVAAVDGVDLTVEPGEVLGLLGANGAGKTTLIRLLLGLIAPDSGEVLLFGRPPDRAARRRVGYVPQGLGLYDDLTVRENAAFSSAAFGVPPPDLHDDPELAGAANLPVRDLPLGLRRRAAFAIALSHHPELLLLDEPTSGVDPLGRARLWDTIGGAADAGAGVVVTTHNMEEAEHCDRLVVMATGRVVVAGTMGEIVGPHRAVEVRAGRWERAFEALEVAGLTAALHGRSLRVPDVDVELVREILDASGVEAQLDVVPARFEEAFVALARANAHPS